MKTDIRRIMALVLALMMLLGVASAVAEDDFAGTVTISVQSKKGVEEAWKAVGEAYMAKHPGVKVVVDLKPEEGYAEWVKAQFQNYEDALPEADIVAGNLAGGDRVDKTINYFDYAYEDDPYYDGEWNESIAFDMQNKKNYNAGTGAWDTLSVTGTQVLWFYNADIFAEVGVEPPTTWDEFVAICEKLEAAGYQPLAVPGTFQSFWARQIGWLAQIYADQTTRANIEIVRAQEGDYCYDPEVDGVFVYDPTDPHNDDTTYVNNNPVRFWRAFVKDGTIRADTEGMKTVWSNLARIFPKYSGGENFYGTDEDGAKTLFYQGKAAIWLDGSWFFGDYLNTMKSIDDENAEDKIEGLKKFELGTFVMPSMEGEGIVAKARTIEVANGFLSAIRKDVDHDDMVVDFLMFYSSPEGYFIYLDALIEARGVPEGVPLVKGVELEGELASMFANVTYIGNCQKGFGRALARGIGDNQEALRAWYAYSMDFLNGKITVDEWATMHQENQYKYAPDVLATNKISMNDLENPQNEPTGN